MKGYIALVVVMIALLVAAPLAAISPYDVITPGGAYDLTGRVSVPDQYRQPSGRMAFTAVYEEDATWAQVLRARIVPLAQQLPVESSSRAVALNVTGVSETVPRELIRPAGVSQQQLNQQNKQAIDQSKPVAAAVALEKAGYNVSISGQGAEVQSVISGMPADGVLQPGDVIVAVDGQPTRTTGELIAATQKHAVGDTVHLTLLRNGQQQQLDVTTRPSPSDASKPAVGVTIADHVFDVHLPFPVDVESGDVGGPSAGLMFALAILDAITPGDLTRGYYVAGTGTLDAQGQVGAIGGAAEKVAAAEEDGAQVFLTPRDNEADALNGARGIRVLPVSTFDDAVAALCALPPATADAASAQPSPCAGS